MWSTPYINILITWENKVCPYQFQIIVIQDRCDMPLSILQQELFLDSNPIKLSSQGKGWFLIKMEFPWLSYSPERQSLLFIMGIYYSRVQKILFLEKKTEILLIYVLEKVRSTVSTCILQNLTSWEFWESKVSSWTHTKNTSFET